MNKFYKLALLAVLIPLAAQTQNRQNDPCEMSNGRPKFCNEPLAISLIEFKGVQYFNDVQLTWEAKEDNLHSHYLIQRSDNGVDFKVVGETTNQEFIDKTVKEPCYYRLVDVDLSGLQTVHKIIFVNYTSATYQVYKINGEYVNTFTAYSDIPRNQALIINKKKVTIK